MNIVDYIQWRGNLSFRTDPFNEVDNLVFSQLIYADLEFVMDSSEKLTIRELGERFFHSFPDQMKEGKIFNSDGVEILEKIMNTGRYGDCVIYNYQSKLHHDTAEHFTVCMIDLPDRTTVVCFKGTDDSLIGWKEDFYLSYKDIAGQRDALLYVNRYCSVFRKYRLIGHSKGGNLAIYAAVHCKPLIRRNIIQIISNDGPGLRPGSYLPESYRKVKDRYTLIVPEKDGVGTIYEMDSRKVIARILTKNIVEAHGVMSWQIDQNRIVQADADSYQTDQTRMALIQFMKETTPEQREIFVEDVFQAFSDAGISTVGQLAKGGLPVVFRVLKELSEMDGIAKSIAVKLLKTLSVSVSSGMELPRKIGEQKDRVVAKARILEEKLAEKKKKETVN